MTAPPAQRDHLLPPELTEDAISEILLRLPPDDPACLVRASLVCKPWCRLLSDPAFLHRYRVFHRTPPLLVFLHNTRKAGVNPQFVTTTVASPCSRPMFDRCCWWNIIECRHGRALVHSIEPRGIIVWDPITGDQQHVPMPSYPYTDFSAMVLCAVDGCDHLACHGGPFLVVFVGADEGRRVTWASIYSSGTGAWRASTSLDLYCRVSSRPSLLCENALYRIIAAGDCILKYDLGGHGLSVMDPPSRDARSMTLVTLEDGGLGFAAVVDHYRLYLWSWQTGVDGNAGWAQCRVIELETLLPIGIRYQCHQPVVVGFAEGTDTIFISTYARPHDGIFAIKLKSGQVRRIGESVYCCAIVPYMSFYTPGSSLVPV